MTLTSFLTFVFVYALAAGSPGPGMTAIVARTLGGGFRGGAWFALGVIFGDLVWLTAAVAGLSAIAHTFYWLFLAIRYLGMAYLLYIAWKLWTTPVKAEHIEAGKVESARRLTVSGLALTLGNPKTMVFYLAILPTVVDLDHVGLMIFAEIAATVVVVLMLISAGYIALTLKARDALASTRARTILNRVAGTALAGAAAAIAWR